MEIIWIILVLLLLGLALVGTFVPVLPSITIAWVAMFILFTVAEDPISTSLMVWIIVAGLVVKALDYVLPLWGVKAFGGTKEGVRGATIGLIIASVLPFTPFGWIFPAFAAIIVFPIIGAFVAEMIAEGGNFSKAVGGAMGSLLGFFVSVGLKFALVIWYIWIAVTHIFSFFD